MYPLPCPRFRTPLLALATLLLGSLLALSCSPPGQFAGITVVYMAGGNEDHPFARTLARGARDAARDLGIELSTVWSGWNKEQILLDFKSAIDRKPDAICLLGYPGTEAARPFVAEARRKGIVVTSHNVELPALEQELAGSGFGYVGQSVTGSGTRLAREAIAQSRVDTRSRIAVFGVPGIPGRGDRTKAIMAELERQGLAWELFDCTALNTDPSGLEAELERSLGDGSRWDLVFTDILPAVVAAWMERQGLDPESFFCAAFDISTQNVAALEKGYFDLLLDQQPYLQGYLPVLNAALSVRYGFAGLHINTEAALVDRGNLGLIDPWIKEGVR